MEVIIRGEPKEIAALVWGIQERPSEEITKYMVEKLDEFTHQNESTRAFQYFFQNQQNSERRCFL